MGIFTANSIPVGGDYSAVATFPQGGGVFPQPYTKVDAQLDTDGYCQLLEDREGWQNLAAHEIFIPQGFHSIPLDTAICGIRFRTVTGAATLYLRLFN